MRERVMADCGGAGMRGRTAAGMRVCVAVAVAMADGARTAADTQGDAGVARVAVRVAGAEAAIPAAGM